MKKSVSLALILVLVLSMCAAGHAAPVLADDTMTAAQLNLIYSNLSSFKQDDASGTWRYSITDLDHNGRFEILAAGVMSDGHSTVLKAWEVNADMKSFIACNVNLNNGKSFPDIIAENADTYYVAGTDSWYYMFNNDTVVSQTEVVTEKCSVSYKNGNFSTETYGSATSTAENGMTIVSYMDSHGALVTPDAYNAFGANAFPGAEKSSTNFSWFSASDVQDATRLATSYAVFKGTAQPAKAPVTQAAAPAATPEILIVNTPSTFLSITKNPTSETHYAGETALFVANATNWTSLSWTFVSPSGGQFSSQGFAGSFPYATVTGTGGTTLSIANLNEGMNGWGVFCTFYSNGQSARTNTAYMYVYQSPSPYSKTYTYTNSGERYELHIAYNPDGSTYDTITCPICHREVSMAEGRCPYCGYDIWGIETQNYTYSNNGDVYEIHEVYNPDGSTYDTVTCPSCWREVSMAMERCPYCGYDIWGNDTDDYAYTYSNSGEAYEIHEAYNPDGSTYDTVTCPNCYTEVSMAYGFCPQCGYDIWG